MSTKRPALGLFGNHKRQKSSQTLTYLQNTLQESGLVLKNPPEKCLATAETVNIIRNIEKKLTRDTNYPSNLHTFYSDFKTECANNEIFKHYLFLNVVKQTDGGDTMNVSGSVIKILLNVSVLQNELIDFIMDKAMDMVDDPTFETWIQAILKSFSTLNMINDTKRLTSKLMDLLTISSQKDVRLQIISQIPDIIGDQEHDNVALNMVDIIVDDRYLLPAVLDCWSYLCLSDTQCKELHEITLNLMSPSNAAYFSSFIKFLLAPTWLNESNYMVTVREIRKNLAWSELTTSPHDIATSQVLAADAIRTSMVSSKAIASAWSKVVSSCNLSTDHRPIDIVILIIMYSASHDYHKTVEDVVKKQVKSETLTESLLDAAFDEYLKIIMITDNLESLMCIANALLKASTEPSLGAFASHIYSLLIHKTSAGPRVVAELLNLGMNCKKSIISVLNILNEIATQNLSTLRSYSLPILTLLDRMDDMTLTEIRAVMNLVCCLAYGYEDSAIRNDVNIIINKQLSSSLRSVKIRGILAGLHAVKYLVQNNEEAVDIPDTVSFGSSECFPEGPLREAATMIYFINLSAILFADLHPFFYDELLNILKSTSNINPSFLNWLTSSLTDELTNNFIVDSLKCENFGDIRVSMQCHLNTNTEVDEELAMNVAGLTLDVNDEVNIGSLSSLFKVVRFLTAKLNDGQLDNIDALLGCSVVMPVLDIDAIEEYRDSEVSEILDCLVHCVNLFRELLNGFASQSSLISKILSRIDQLRTYEDMIEQIIHKRNISYRAPTYYSYAPNTSNVGFHTDRRVKPKKSKHTDANANKQDTVIADSGRTQPTQSDKSVRSKLDVLQNINLRPLDLSLLGLLNCKLSTQDIPDTELSFEALNYLMKHINGKLEKILISKIKRTMFHVNPVYDPVEAEKQAQAISDILPKIKNHINVITEFLDHHAIDNESMCVPKKMLESFTSLEHLYNLCTVHFKWVEFKNNHSNLLEKSLKSFLTSDDEMSKEDVIESIAKYLQTHKKYCLVLSTAVSLTGFITALRELSTRSNVTIILKDVAESFLSKQWKTPDGLAEKGIVYNQNINLLLKAYLTHINIGELKTTVCDLVGNVNTILQSTDNVLTPFKSINRLNFHILFKALCEALVNIVKHQTYASLTTSEHLSLWSDASITLKNLLSIAITLNKKNILSDFSKNYLLIVSEFLKHGASVFKRNLNESGRKILIDFALICSHRKLNSDDVLSKKSSTWVLEREKFNRLLKDICPEALNVSHGESRRNRPSVDRRRYINESVEDADDQLPDDDIEDSEDDLRAGSEERSGIL